MLRPALSITCFCRITLSWRHETKTKRIEWRRTSHAAGSPVVVAAAFHHPNGLDGCKQEAKVAADTKTVAAAAADINPVGTYALMTVDGKKVPCTVQHEGHTMTINSGSFSINADGGCSSKMSLAGRDAAIEVKATYTREGPNLRCSGRERG
jgi:hypothetical protein